MFGVCCCFTFSRMAAGLYAMKLRMVAGQRTLVTLTGDATNDVVHAFSALESAAQTEFISLHVITKN